jgi:hypothetical protein
MMAAASVQGAEKLSSISVLECSIGMRGKQPDQPTFIFLVDIEAKIKPNHPLRQIKAMADEILASMDDLFDKMYSTWGGKHPPELALKAKLIQALFYFRRQAVTDENGPFPLVP